ncbi:hypothetical protein [Carnobacterium pleistocenium]|uniref:hypothetical protein n=1 Tax=Carnobacterium pleistocenium TaxID=181073 RepID=UPI00055188AB|nr:hypothetical protein [Carnobacterium pleistocenium]
MYIWLSFFCVLGFALIHFFSKSIHFAHKASRNKFLSFTAGVAVSYVFVLLLPELNDYQQNLLLKLEYSPWRYLENHIYIIALVGLVLFYTLENLVKLSKESPRFKHPEDASSGIFWIHICSFFVYNAIIGYLLIQEEFKSPLGLLFYFIALGVHFVTNDWSLRRDHKKIYDQYGRILLTLAIFLGWLIGALTELNELVISVLQAFIAGGVILNVLKEELPQEKESSITSFLLGAFGYTFLLSFI